MFKHNDTRTALSTGADIFQSNEVTYITTETTTPLSMFRAFTTFFAMFFCSN